jgi:hypothetical protein
MVEIQGRTSDEAYYRIAELAVIESQVATDSRFSRSINRRKAAKLFSSTIRITGSLSIPSSNPAKKI